jgi:predicted lysophospholipase L1 biosynthesis ABC-type transport system permease subunit
VGIVSDVRQQGPGHDAEPQIYTPYGQQDADRMSVLLELQPGASLPVDEIRQLVRDVAPDLPVDRVERLSARYAATTEQTRFLTLLLSVFAVLGLALAVAGTYATAAHALSTRTRELGIRVALGARTGMLFRLVLRRALAIVGNGIAAGIAITWPLTHFLDSQIYGITSHDPATLTMGAAVIALCAVLASLGPALRAMRVDPNQVLRIG